MAKELFAVDKINDPRMIRLMVYASGEMGHVALSEALAPVANKVSVVAQRVMALEEAGKLISVFMTKLEDRAKALEERLDALDARIKKLESKETQ